LSGEDGRISEDVLLANQVYETIEGGMNRFYFSPNGYSLVVKHARCLRSAAFSVLMIKTIFVS